jgi:hypothetical protein
MVAVINGRCEIFVQGMAIQCPFCKTLVHSGEHHVCEIGGAKKPAAKKRSRKPKPTEG